MLAVGDARAHPSMSSAEQDLRRRLRAHGRQLGDGRDAETGEQKIDRLAHEVAYEHWHRMLFARFLAENELLIEQESGVAVSLADCEELAREQGQDRWTLAGRFAESMLPRIFRSDDPALAVRLAPETRQELERLVEALPAEVFTARDALGWTYQFWQAERKDAVNKSGVKIGADELPAVTQLTERYMVLFLLHNTVGAWRAVRILAAQPERAATAASEEELRRAVRLEADGGYDFSYLRFVREPRDGDDAEQPTGPWRPAAGRFEGWPRTAADLRVFDPCCGSGHFLIECLDLLVRLRMEKERLAPGAAIDAVLRDNLSGLEIDPRCTQIAAFNLALTAWTWPDAGGYRRLPDLNLTCSGLAPNAPRDEWTRLSDDAADAGGLPSKRDLFGVEDTLMSAPLRNSLGALHDLFAQAPVLGSLIDPRAVEADLYQHDYEAVRGLLGVLLERERGSDERTERAVAAQGMARAAELLAGRYHLVITNEPYLARRKQSDELKQFAQDRHSAAKGDLATLFVSRIFGWLDKHGVHAVVTPQNWLSQTSYKKLREMLLKQRTWNLVARLGPGAFETIGGHVVNVALSVLSTDRSRPDSRMAGIDVSGTRDQKSVRADEKAVLLRGRTHGADVGHASNGAVHVLGQRRQLDNPDSILLFNSGASSEHLSRVALAYQGKKYPNGLPEPYSDDPTQWIFHGHPCGGIAWDEDAKRIVHGPRRIDTTVLQVAVARLLGYRWPAEQDPELRLAAEVRECVAQCRNLAEFADADGIVCLPPVGGEFAAADRLRQLLVAAYGTDWTAETERRHLVAAAGRSEPVDSIEAWLRDRFFEEHCQHFLQRPFVWHIWDGRRDGFHALLNYHRLAGSDGVGRRTLEALTYSHLGDWMARQKADRDQGLDGADGRLAAAQDLQHQLKKIIAGEPPCDVFVRWKPLGEQPIGWEPDINDGIRINIRPFMSADLSRRGRVGAGILRVKPKIKWSKDRGQEPRNLRSQDEYPWFWGCPGDRTQTERTDFRGGADFDGKRWNDLHYTNAVKRAARSRSTVEAGS
ncbi:MAG: N-6 DNA methylase [Acidobacteria bacterium]|nr:N-6 DNA methylase [Acidobacteriota bacterium]